MNLELGTKRELFVDNYLIERMEGTRQVLQTPVDKGPAILLDKPWEGIFSGYTTILRDGDLFRAYYRGWTDLTVGEEAADVCYAESTDGINWTKPELGLVEAFGTCGNNILLADNTPAMHNFQVFKDGRPGVPADEKYKALGGRKKEGLKGYVSADGIHWRRLKDEAVFYDAYDLNKFIFDSLNVCFWSEFEQKYVLYYRRSHAGIRSIGLASSEDFANWSEPVQMEYSDTGSDIPSDELYTNNTQPYFRAPHIYIALPARFVKGRQVVTDEEAETIGVHPNYFKDTSDGLFMSTRAGSGIYDRTCPEGFVRPGIGPENWISRTNYPATGILQTGPSEMSLYVNQDYAQPTAHLRRYTLRLDGFISINAPRKGGEMVTKPFSFTGKNLYLNYATSAAGTIKIEVQNGAGEPLMSSVEFGGNVIEKAVAWESGADLSSVEGKTVRLRFMMSDADIFSMHFS